MLGTYKILTILFFFGLYYFQQNEDKLFDLYILLFVFPSGEKIHIKASYLQGVAAIHTPGPPDLTRDAE